MNKFSVTAFAAASVLALSFATSANATPVASTKSQVEVARVVQHIPLVQKSDIQVAVVVEDMGGSTDLSPTQKFYLTLYSKGEMFSTDATFMIAHVYKVISAKRISGGVYSVTVIGDYNENGPVQNTYVVNAADAINKIKAVDCGGDFDCAASTDFKAEVDVTVRR